MISSTVTSLLSWSTPILRVALGQILDRFRSEERKFPPVESYFDIVRRPRILNQQGSNYGNPLNRLEDSLLDGDTIPDGKKTYSDAEILQSNISFLNNRFPYMSTSRKEGASLYHVKDFRLPISDPERSLRKVRLPLDSRGKIIENAIDQETVCLVPVLLNNGYYYQDSNADCPSLVWYDRSAQGLSEDQRKALDKLWDTTASERDELLNRHPFLVEQALQNKCLIDDKRNFSRMLDEVRLILLSQTPKRGSVNIIKILFSRHPTGFPTAELSVNGRTPSYRPIGSVDVQIALGDGEKLELSWDLSKLVYEREEFKQGMERVLAYLKDCSV